MERRDADQGNKWREIELQDSRRRYLIGSGIAIVVVVASIVSIVYSLTTGRAHTVFAACAWIVGISIAWIISRILYVRQLRRGNR